MTFRGQLQCRTGAKREGPIEAYSKFWNLYSVEKQAREPLRIPTWTEAVDLMRKELHLILVQDVLPATLPEFSTVRWMTLRINNQMLVPSMQAREVVEQKQRAFTRGWDPLFVGFSAAA